ncbi:hypothetical protein MG293_011229, partial [Ovis ammon polii]
MNEKPPLCSPVLFKGNWKAAEGETLSGQTREKSLCDACIIRNDEIIQSVVNPPTPPPKKKVALPGLQKGLSSTLVRCRPSDEHVSITGGEKEIKPELFHVLGSSAVSMGAAKETGLTPCHILCDPSCQESDVLDQLNSTQSASAKQYSQERLKPHSMNGTE